MNELIVIGARLVTPDRVIDRGSVIVRRGKIEEVREGDYPGGREAAGAAKGGTGTSVVNARGRWLLPGLIDLHNDSLEKEIEPRPGAIFPHAVALLSLENRLVSHGITTIFHALAFMDGRAGLHRGEELEAAVMELSRLSRLGVIRHLLHARYEIAENRYAELVKRVIASGMVQLVSFMDHTPGQGQFRSMDDLLRFYKGEYRLSEAEIRARLDAHIENSRSAKVREDFEALAEAARAAGLPMASHDDDTVEKVMAMSRRGITISEFPVELEAARAAAGAGQVVIVGAPNVLLGKSNTGNMSAREAIEAGAASVICSDYHAPAMIHAVFLLARRGILGLPEAVRMVSLNPARAVGLDGQIGSIEIGKRADLVLVAEPQGVPVVGAVWVEGRKVYEKRDNGHPLRRPLRLEPGAGRSKRAIHVP